MQLSKKLPKVNNSPNRHTFAQSGHPETAWASFVLFRRRRGTYSTNHEPSAQVTNMLNQNGRLGAQLTAGLPDFSWHNIPKWR
jgi:hypothetical protein